MVLSGNIPFSLQLLNQIASCQTNTFEYIKSKFKVKTAATQLTTKHHRNTNTRSLLTDIAFKTYRIYIPVP